MDDIRWKQRFVNFDRAFVLLREAQERGFDTLSQLEKEGVIQRFEFSFELAWKTLKDYLEEQGVVVQPVTPRQVIKVAFTARMLDDAPIWLEIIQQRNLLSHTYNIKTIDAALQMLDERYFAAFDRLHTFFLERVLDQ